MFLPQYIGVCQEKNEMLFKDSGIVKKGSNALFCFQRYRCLLDMVADPGQQKEQDANGNYG